MTVKFHVGLDSGAHSIFTTSVQKRKALSGLNVSVKVAAQKKFDMSFIESDKFQRYLEKYVAYLKRTQHKLEFYITLDVIYQHELSYDLFVRMQDEFGVNPVPVIHYGADMSLVKRYMDRSDYVAISPRRRNLIGDTWTKDVFKMLSNKKGIPQWKVHGLGVTDIDLIALCPWYSVDASTPFYSAHVGELCIPTRDDPRHPGQLTYRKIPITDRRFEAGNHYLRLSPAQRSVVDAEVERYGFTMDQLKDSYTAREVINMLLFSRVAAELQRKPVREGLEPLRLYTAGNITQYEGATTAFCELVQSGIFERNGVEDVYYLGTFFAKSCTESFLKHGFYTVKRPRLVRNDENSRPRLRA